MAARLAQSPVELNRADPHGSTGSWFDKLTRRTSDVAKMRLDSLILSLSKDELVEGAGVAVCGRD
jgi:hypothetical protein